MNPLTVLPPNARRWLYLVYAILGPVLVWTQSKGWTGEAEYALWIGLGTALGLLAAANTTSPTAVKDDESPTGEVAGHESEIPTGTPVEVTPVDVLTLDDAPEYPNADVDEPVDPTEFVRALQAAAGLKVDGVVGPQTWATLLDLGWGDGIRTGDPSKPPKGKK